MVIVQNGSAQGHGSALYCLWRTFSLEKRGDRWQTNTWRNWLWSETSILPHLEFHSWSILMHYFSFYSDKILIFWLPTWNGSMRFRRPTSYRMISFANLNKRSEEWSTTCHQTTLRRNSWTSTCLVKPRHNAITKVKRFFKQWPNNTSLILPMVTLFFNTSALPREVIIAHEVFPVKKYILRPNPVSVLNLRPPWRNLL